MCSRVVAVHFHFPSPWQPLFHSWILKCLFHIPDRCAIMMCRTTTDFFHLTFFRLINVFIISSLHSSPMEFLGIQWSLRDSRSCPAPLAFCVRKTREPWWRSCKKPCERQGSHRVCFHCSHWHQESQFLVSLGMQNLRTCFWIPTKVTALCIADVVSMS